MKKILKTAAAAMFLGIFAIGSASATEVEFNGITVEFDQPAVIIENRTMVPVRKIFELLGAQVTWDSDTRTVKTELNGKSVDITIDKNEIIINGKSEAIDASARIVNNRTLVPLRAVSQSYGCKVSWDSKAGVASVFADWYANAEKKQYDSDIVSLGYFFDVLPTVTENGVSFRSNACTLSVGAEKSDAVTINDAYLADLKKGISKFSGLTLLEMRKTEGKNAVKFSCRNNERTIYYLYAFKNGTAYNLALTVPVGAERIDAEKLMYTINNFAEKF